ncbi:MAG TPA: DNA alkylation repair protein [Patescibacteria group bacterium]|nr:DNA alkylation repair protein [Patescibacteria group bacterium]
MATAAEILAELKTLGTEQTRKTLKNHGGPDNMYGVKIGNMKPIQKRIKKNHALSLELFKTGISDAMYLAGLISEPKKMSREQLQNWVENSVWHMISDNTVAWVAAESSFGWELANEWINSPKEDIATAGWNTLSGIVALRDDNELNVDALKNLLKRIEAYIHTEQNRVRYTMNGFVISVGTYVAPLREIAIATAEKIGKVSVYMGNTACKVPLASEYIVKSDGKPVKKKKTVIC